MGKSVYIAEKPSVAQEFAKALHVNFKRKDGYLEADEHIVTWCVGHLITMSYPEAYDENLKKWRFDTLPFIPGQFKYEVIPAVKKQFDIVKNILNRDDVETIYVCTAVLRFPDEAEAAKDLTIKELYEKEMLKKIILWGLIFQEFLH